MPNYKRNPIAGGTYFFTLVTHNRRPWLCTISARKALRDAIEKIRQKYPFVIEAFVLLPDHLHCIWRLPDGDGDFSTRWRLIKTEATKTLAAEHPSLLGEQNASITKRREETLWQRRFWEHAIRNDDDFQQHFNYIHYNPVKHGLCQRPGEWPYSTFAKFVNQGFYPEDWAISKAPICQVILVVNEGGPIKRCVTLPLTHPTKIALRVR